jgi:hypothetical protein
MSSEVMSVMARLEGDAKGFVSAFDSGAQALSRIEASASNTATSVASSSDRMSKSMDTVAASTGDVAGQIDGHTDKAGDSFEDLGKDAEESAQDVDKAGDKSASATEKSSGRMSGALKTAGTAFGLAAAAAAAAAAGLVIASVASFGELEQNLGGSEAVFGSYAQTIQDTGVMAYKNLGISQSEYLATANKMGALFQGSGIEQVDALNMTQDAMQRAADMASVMGIDMGIAMDSVAGAAKGNFTMMDNLGVAMNATSIEAYAAGQGFTDFSFATATSAEKADMAMKMFMDNTSQYAGNFAKESTETITGSLGLLQASAASLLAGLGDANADTAQLAGNVVDAFQAVVSNVVPIIENIAAALPEALGAMVDAAGPLIGSLGGVITGLIPTILDAAMGLAEALLEGVATVLPELMTMLPGVIVSMVGSIATLLPLLINAGMQAITALLQGIAETLPTLIPTIVQGLIDAVSALIENLPMLLDAGMQIIFGLVEGLITALPILIEQLPTLIVSIIDFILGAIPMLIEAGLALFVSLVEALPEIITGIVSAIPQIIMGIQSAVLSSIPVLIEAGIKLLIAMVTAMPTIIKTIVAAIPQIVTGLVTAIMDSLPQLVSAGKDMITGLWEGIKGAGDWLWKQMSNFFGGIIDKVKGLLGIHSPSKVFAEMGKNVGLGMAEGVLATTKDVQSAMADMVAVPTMDPMKLSLSTSNASQHASNGWEDRVGSDGLSRSAGRGSEEKMDLSDETIEKLARALASERRGNDRRGKLDPAGVE